MAFIQQPFRPKQQTNQSGVIGGSEEQAPEGQEAVSNWTNLNAYISGNQGQGAAIADKLLESGNQEVGKFKTAGEDFAKAANDQVSQGAKKDTWSSLFKDGDVGGMTADQKRAYTEWKNSADYSGPQDASQAKGYGDVSKQLDRTKGEVARSATLAGQAGLAKESLGKGNNNYNAGMSMLDSIIARQAGGGEKLDAFQAQSKDISLDGINQSVNKAVNTAKAQGRAAVSSAQSALDNRLGGLAGILHDRESSGGYVNDLTRRDLATDPELAAIENLLELGASAGDNMRSDLSNLSGNDNVTRAQQEAAAEARAAAQEAEVAAQPASVPDLGSVVATQTPASTSGDPNLLDSVTKGNAPVELPNIDDAAKGVADFVGTAQTGFKRKKRFSI
jgi:hypothetical protein